MDELQALEQWAGALLARMDPARRRAVAMDVGRALRRSQQTRIAAQKNPEGTPYEPRKPRQVAQGGTLRTRAGRIKLFVKMRTAKHMKLAVEDGGVSVGFSGRVARLARIHQDGETAEVARGRSYSYPVRKLLGLTQQERDMIRDKLLASLAG